MARRRRRRPRRGSGGTGRVPPELHRAYGTRARTLGHAVLSLLPPPPPPGTPCPVCRSGAGCLACRRWAHLLREGDTVAYRSLVTRAVCAVAPDAPPPPRYTPGNAGHSQSMLVREIIKSIMMEDRACTTKNVLCSGSREGGQPRCLSTRDLVSSSSWDILLHRIGDLLMCYILRHSSIFLPVKKNIFFQVTGLALNVVLQKTISMSTKAKYRQPQSMIEKCPMPSARPTPRFFPFPIRLVRLHFVQRPAAAAPAPPHCCGSSASAPLGRRRSSASKICAAYASPAPASAPPAGSLARPPDTTSAFPRGLRDARVPLLLCLQALRPARAGRR
ncbi:hypothetical protein U9M48_042437 [Paspalum notatum var. saurae]|uniref:Telomerase reverse transcriptase n=1 Tax=Paspalum notatum var. saurae TaxID=547442 RepID=A0AAQ3UQU2_PASNO